MRYDLDGLIFRKSKGEDENIPDIASAWDYVRVNKLLKTISG